MQNYTVYGNPRIVGVDSFAGVCYSGWDAGLSMTFQFIDGLLTSLRYANGDPRYREYHT